MNDKEIHQAVVGETGVGVNTKTILIPFEQFDLNKLEKGIWFTPVTLDGIHYIKLEQQSADVSPTEEVVKPYLYQFDFGDDLDPDILVHENKFTPTEFAEHYNESLTAVLERDEDVHSICPEMIRRFGYSYPEFAMTVRNPHAWDYKIKLGNIENTTKAEGTIFEVDMPSHCEHCGADFNERNREVTFTDGTTCLMCGNNI